MVYNFKDTTDDFNNIIDKLYIRQALAHLENEPGYIKAFFYGAGGQAFGPIPSLPKSPYTPSNASTNPYPFSPSAAAAILKANGWTVVPNGTDTCAKPGTGAGECGAGITGRPEAGVERHLGRRPGDHRRAGAGLGVRGQDGRDHDEPVVEQLQLHDQQLRRPRLTQDDQQVGDGGLRRVVTDSTYPTTFGVFNIAGSSNLGGYADPQADKLITDSISSPNPERGDR